MPEDRFHPQSRSEWRTWLSTQHARVNGLWVVIWRKGSGHEPLSYEDIVEEAVCFGWIDSKVRGLDETRTMRWVAPRKPGSGWSRSNKERIIRLQEADLMATPGQAVIDAAIVDGSWNLLDNVENLVVPDDLGLALAAHPPAADEWESFPPSAKRAILSWIVHAKRPDTRAQRIEETARRAATGERANE
ncbi:MAG: YdeI/OmpD-associated family protein [Actinomycetes bacterium]